MDDLSRFFEDVDTEDILERVTRRRLLVGGAAVTGTVGAGSLLFGQDGDTEPTPSDRLTTAETRFTGVATTLTETDVADPYSSWGLRNEIETALSSVNQILSDDFPDEPEIQQRLSALRTTTEYYNTLLTSLTAANSLYESVSDSEPDVLKQTGELDYDPASKLDSSSFEQSIAQLAAAEKAPSEVTFEVKRLFRTSRRFLTLSVPNERSLIDTFVHSNRM